MNWKSKILLGVVVLSLAWVVGKNAYDLFCYWRLSGEAPAVVELMEVTPLSASKFAYTAKYHFEVKGKRYNGKEVLSFPIYPNKYAADGELAKLRSASWTAYYAPANPEICTLERPFPWKGTLYALLVVVIFLYFVFFFARYKSQ